MPDLLNGVAAVDLGLERRGLRHKGNSLCGKAEQSTNCYDDSEQIRLHQYDLKLHTPFLGG